MFKGLICRTIVVLIALFRVMWMGHKMKKQDEVLAYIWIHRWYEFEL